MNPPPPYPPPLYTAGPDPSARGTLAVAAAAGFAAALVGAVLWAVLAAVTNFKIGFAAVGVGFLVGAVMRTVGHGNTPAYGYVGAALALLGCVVGDVLSDCVFVAQHLGQPVLDTVSRLTPTTAVMLLQANFRPLDALFYFIALRAGYRYAFIKRALPLDVGNGMR